MRVGVPLLLLVACGAPAEPGLAVSLPARATPEAPAVRDPSPDPSLRSEARNQITRALIDDDVATVEQLITADAALTNALDENGATPLIDAAFYGALASTKLLLLHGAAIDAVNKRGDSAIGRAMEYGNWEVVALLLDKDPTLPPFALSVAARDGRDAIVDRLIATGVSATTTQKGCNALHAVAKSGNGAMARKLIKLGASIEAACDNDGFTPLMVAAQAANEEVVAVLLELGARTDPRDHGGRTALHWAAYGYRPEEVRVYREHGHTTMYRPPPPALAMKALLDKRAAIDALDQDGNTALHEAVLVGANTAIDLLVARRANRRLRNKDGKTALDLATERGTSEMVSRLSAR